MPRGSSYRMERVPPTKFRLSRHSFLASANFPGRAGINYARPRLCLTRADMLALFELECTSNCIKHAKYQGRLRYDWKHETVFIFAALCNYFRTNIIHVWWRVFQDPEVGSRTKYLSFFVLDIVRFSSERCDGTVEVSSESKVHTLSYWIRARTEFVRPQTCSTSKLRTDFSSLSTSDAFTHTRNVFIRTWKLYPRDPFVKFSVNTEKRTEQNNLPLPYMYSY